MMLLYHYTERAKLYAIATHGLAIGGVPIARHRRKIGVWLTSSMTSEGHGISSKLQGLGGHRLTAEVDDGPLLFRWTAWSAWRVQAGIRRHLHHTGEAYDSWWLYFGVIPPSSIRGCVELRTGRSIDLRDLSPGAGDHPARTPVEEMRHWKEFELPLFRKMSRPWREQRRRPIRQYHPQEPRAGHRYRK
jgi:hypothetical protein